MAKVQEISREMDKKPSPDRSTLSKVAAIALLGTSLAYFANLLLVLIAAQTFIPPLLILGVVTLLPCGSCDRCIGRSGSDLCSNERAD